MAIYKPSNSTPFLSTVDLTVAQYLECEIHTSNVPITGYKLRLLDGNNDVVFEGTEYSDISSDSVLNGSTLKVPLVIVGAVPTTNSNPNAFYYTNEKYYNSENVEIANFYNGYAKQPYKWQVTLCQGTPVGNPDEKWYDMLVTSGVTMGSNKDRIQGPVSNEIYMDYYVQLYSEKPTEDNKSAVAVGLRALISSYDSTNGYIYPYFGTEGLEEEYVEQASYFQVFENTNNPEYITASRIVDYATTVSLENVEVGGVTAELTMSTNTSYQYTQVYEGISEEAYNSFVPLVSLYDTEVVGEDTTELVLGDTTLLVKNESSSTEESDLNSSAKNGVYTYEGKSWDSGTSSMTLTWQRAADATAWANFIGKAFYITSGSSSGINYESNAETSGVINSTPLFFFEEKAIELYSDLDGTEDYGVDYGPVYKNTLETTYLRPFIGLTEGMRLYYTDSDNVEQYLDIASVNTSSWGVNFTEDLTEPFETGVDYEIRSFLKVGDENPFYGYATPTLDFDFEYDNYIAATGVYVVTNRTLSPVGTYEQSSNQGWKNYTWTLIDDTLNYTYPSTTLYTGNIEGYFQGLLNGHSYTLILTVEDNNGRTVEAQKYILIDLGEPETLFPMSVEFDCDTQSVWLDFTQQGVITPSPITSVSVEEDGLSYSDGEITIEDDTNNFDKETQTSLDPDLKGAAVRYENILLLGKTTAPLNGPKTESFTLNSQHTSISEYYEGALFEQIIKVQDTNYLVKLIGILPRSVVYNTETEVYEENVYRNSIEVLYFQSDDNGATWEQRNIGYDIANLNLTNYTLDTEEEEDVWRDGQPVVYAFVKDRDSISEECDYLATTHPYTRYLTTSLETYKDDLLEDLTNYWLSDMTGEIYWIVNEELYNISSDLLNSSGSMLFPLNATASDEGNLGIWLDRKTRAIEQADGTYINAFVGEETYQQWQDASLYWCDKGLDNGELYNQLDANEENNHTGRQDIADKTLTFNISVKDYDPTQITEIIVTPTVFIKKEDTT